MKRIITSLIIVSTIIICILCLRGKISGEKFDSEKWKTADMNQEENWSIRWDMMNSLRNDYILIGMSKKDIIKLLGNPDDSLSTENVLRYHLGYSKTGINTGSLSLIFKNGIVDRIHVWQG